MKHTLSVTFLALLTSLVVLAAARSGQTSLAVNGDAIQGGRIYDNWVLALDLAPPQGDQPLWQTQETNPRSGVSTWRCVECHGWDYKGEDGAFGPYSSHYTGFTGLADMVGSTEDQVVNWLNGSINPSHNFLPFTNSVALQDLSAFLRTQQVDMDLLIDPGTGEALGDRQNGREVYLTACLSCHGPSGDLINLGSNLEPIYLGDLAIADPWQTVHKIRFGTPTNARMPASEDMGWSLSRVADVLAYTQTLRRGNPDFVLITNNSGGAVEVERQAQIEPIIWAAFIVLAVILASVAWDIFVEKQSQASVAKGSKTAKK